MGLKTVAILFVFGATIASGQFMPRLIRPTPYDMSVMPYLRSNGCPSAPELAPVICQFMEPHMGLFKPQLIAPSTYIPPLVVEKCDEPQLVIEFPPQKTIVIPEAPILPPITIPKFPVPVIEPIPIVEPCEPAPIVVTSGAADVMVTDFNISTAPVFPPLEPEIMEIHGADMSEDFNNDQSLMVSNLQFIQPLAPIPPAPELPPARLPELPVHIDIPPQPIAPPMIMEQGIQTIAMQGFSAIPMMAPLPQPIPPMIIEHVEEPCITGEIVHHPEPMFIAQPPRIPHPMPPMIVEHVEEHRITGEIVHRPGPMFIAQPPRIPHPMPPMIIEHVEEPRITGEIVRHPGPMFIAQPPRIPQPTPIFAAHEQAIISDPCEPAIQPVMKMAERPYFARTMPSYIPTGGPGLYPDRRMLPYMRRI